MLQKIASIKWKDNYGMKENTWNHISDHGLIPRIYNKFLQFTIKDTNNPISKMKEGFECPFLQGNYTNGR